MSKKINKNSFKLLIGNFLFRGAKVVFQIFINIYLWKATGSIQVLAIFNIMTLLGHMVGALGIAHFVKQGHRRIIHFISLLAYIGIYTTIIFLGQDFTQYAYTIGLVYGLFSGTYYTNLIVMGFDFSHFKNRGNIEGWKKSSRILAKVLFPALFGIIIGWYDMNAALVVGIVLFILSFLVSDIKYIYSKGGIRYISFLREVGKKKEILFSLLGGFFFTLGFSILLLELIIPLMVYDELGTEIQLGFSLSFISLLSIIVTYIFGRFIDYKHYNNSLILLTLTYILSLLGIIFSHNFVTLLFFASLTTTTIILYSIGVGTIVSNAIHVIKDYDEYKVEFTVFKELVYMLGWSCSFMIIYFSPDLSPDSMKSIFYMLIVFSIISTLFLMKINIHEIEQ